MRHVNGLYTQRYNRLKSTDGPLFRGRYKAILVEADAYGLRLSRYINRNPNDIKPPLVDKLEDYPWSSYPCYINQTESPRWLYRDLVYDQLGAKQRYKAHARYVGLGLDEETESFYSKGNQAAILGGVNFVQLVKSEHEEKKQLIDQHQGNYPSINTIIEAVAEKFCMEVKEITKSRRGRGSENIPRWVAIYLCRELSQATLKVIAGEFGIAHISGVSRAVHKLKQILGKNAKIKASFKTLNQQLTP
jgi:putative transposase